MLNKILFILSILIILILIPNLTLAGNLKDAFFPPSATPPQSTPLGDVAKTAGYDTDESQGAKIDTIISTIIAAVLSFLGVIFLMLMVYGGFLWMNARGNEQQVTKAKDLITAAIIGLVIVLAAYAISYFIIDRLSSETLK